MYAGLSSPANYKDNWNSINLIVQKARNRIYYVTLARVLHIYDRDLARCQVIASCKSRAVSLICRDNVMRGIDAVLGHEIIA